jgi:hypothetical protein
MMRLGSVAALTLGFAAAACQSSPAALPYTPYQGINIDSSSLVAPYGCGMGAGQVYRYVATLIEIPIVDGGDASDGARPDAGPDKVLTTGVFDCFADAVFEGTPVAPASFALNIYAFTYAESGAAGIACDPEASPCVPPALDAGANVSGYSWTTTCTAFAETGASIVAQCGPLLPSSADAGVSVGSGADAASNGETSVDAGADAEAAAEPGAQDGG